MARNIPVPSEGCDIWRPTRTEASSAPDAVAANILLMDILTLQSAGKAHFPLQAWFTGDLLVTSGFSSDAFGTAINVSELPIGSYNLAR